MTVVILGVGNRFRGDDAIGSIIAEELIKKTQDTRSKMQDIVVYDTETTPENYIDKVVEAKPEWVIFIDACNFKGKAGEYKIFHDDEIKEVSYGLLSTHTLPLTLTIELIKKQHNCKVSLLGIQPKSFLMDSELSPELLAVKEKIIQFIKKLIIN